MSYGLPPTLAVAAAPLLVRVTLSTVSALTRPLVLNSVPANVMKSPYVLVRSSAVMVRALASTVSSPSM